MIYEVTIGEQTYQVELVRTAVGWKCKLGGREFAMDAVFIGNGVLSILALGKSFEAQQDTTAGGTTIVVGRQRFNVTVRDPRSLRSRSRSDTSGQGVKKLVAPMPGKVVRVLAEVGTPVDIGQAVLVIEAMKMQNELKSLKKGRVSKLNVREGAAVEAGQTLAEVE